MRKALTDIFDVLTIGVSLATIFYWMGLLFNRLSIGAPDFRWWLKIIVPQGIVLALALKLFKVF